MKAVYILITLTLMTVSFLLGCQSFPYAEDEKIENIVTTQWIDGKYGDAFYGIQVYIEPQDKVYSVKSTIWFGRGNDYFQDLGVIWTVKTPEEAVKRFGTISERNGIVMIGEHSITKKEIETHR